MVSLVMTILGDDSPHMLHALARAVESCDGQWLDSRLSRVRGKIAGIAVVEVPQDRQEELTDRAEALEPLQVVVNEASGPTGGGSTMHVRFAGEGSPRVLPTVTRFLSARDISLDEMVTYALPSPDPDKVVFHAVATLRLPAGMDATELEMEFTEAVADIAFDIDFRAESLAA